jgi:hypothetical protein
VRDHIPSKPWFLPAIHWIDEGFVPGLMERFTARRCTAHVLREGVEQRPARKAVARRPPSSHAPRRKGQKAESVQP